jgi:hypothetical protein
VHRLLVRPGPGRRCPFGELAGTRGSARLARRRRQRAAWRAGRSHTATPTLTAPGPGPLRQTAAPRAWWSRDQRSAEGLAVLRFRVRLPRSLRSRMEHGAMPGNDAVCKAEDPCTIAVEISWVLGEPVLGRTRCGPRFTRRFWSSTSPPGRGASDAPCAARRAASRRGPPRSGVGHRLGAPRATDPAGDGHSAQGSLRPQRGTRRPGRTALSRTTTGRGARARVRGIRGPRRRMWPPPAVTRSRIVGTLTPCRAGSSARACPEP